MIRLGLTGGIGSGKSTVANLLVESGATLIDADAISRATTAPGGAAMADIAAQFGSELITQQGALNRNAMRQLVFSNPLARLQLEAIIHPLVSRESDRLAKQALLCGCCLLVFDIPLLVESRRWRQQLQQLQQVLVVDCDEALQISRVMLRSNWTPDAVEKVMAQQASRSQRRAAADMVIYNQDITLAELHEQVRQLVQRITL